MANCSICGEKMGIFDRESCSDGFVCKRCRSLFSDLGMDYKTVPADKLKEGWKFFNDRRERAKGFENLQEPGTMVAYVNRAQRLMRVARIPGYKGCHRDKRQRHSINRWRNRCRSCWRSCRW